MAMKDYPLHPITHDWAEMTDIERAELKADLKKNGQKTPILVWMGHVVDGKHRLALCRELKREPTFDTETLRDATENEMVAHVKSLNQFRRANTVPLTEDEKRELIKAELIKDPTRSNNVIAKLVRVSPHTVKKYREQLESSEDPTLHIAKLETTTGADGKPRRRPRPRRKPRTVPQRVPEPAAVEEPAEPHEQPPDADIREDAAEVVDPVIPPAAGNGHGNGHGNGAETVDDTAFDRNTVVVDAAVTFLAAVWNHAIDEGKPIALHGIVAAGLKWLQDTVELVGDEQLLERLHGRSAVEPEGATTRH